MRRIAIIALAGMALLAGCTQGNVKYKAPSKSYPTLYTFNGDKDLVWDATLKALAELEFEVLSADEASGKIETKWTITGYAPPRKCKYGMVSYLENPKRREKLSIVVKPAPAAAPAFPGTPAQPGFAPPAQPGYAPPAQPGYAPPAQPGYAPPAQPGYAPPAQPGAYPGFTPGGGGDVALAQAFPPTGRPPVAGQPAAGAPAAGAARTMVIVVSKGESVLDEECGGEPRVIPLTSDTTTEYRLLFTIGQKLGTRMEPLTF